MYGLAVMLSILRLTISKNIDEIYFSEIVRSKKKTENPSLDPSSRLMSIQNLKTPQPKRIFVGTLCPVLFLTATTNQLDLIGPE